MIARIANFGIVMATVYFAGPLAFDRVNPIIQAAAITLLAFVGKTLLSPEGPEIYLVNGKQDEEEVVAKAKRDCITCDGTGMEPHGHDACPSCGGTGYEE